MDRKANLQRVRIVLVDTQDGANIGSVCRAMKTMGIFDLAIVGDREYDDNRVRTLALHASDIWEHHRRYDTLEEALASSVLTVGSTRRKGKFRKASFVNPEQLADIVSKTGEGTVSIVFGRESDGLTDEEVAQCAMVVTIPTSEAFPSLNLSQAVQIVTYALFNRLKPWPTGQNPVDQRRCEESVQRAIAAMDGIGYFKQPQEKLWTFRFVRDVFERAQLTESELQRMEKVFVKMSRISAYKRGDEHE